MAAEASLQQLREFSATTSSAGKAVHFFSAGRQQLQNGSIAVTPIWLMIDWAKYKSGCWVNHPLNNFEGRFLTSEVFPDLFYRVQWRDAARTCFDADLVCRGDRWPLPKADIQTRPTQPLLHHEPLLEWPGSQDRSLSSTYQEREPCSASPSLPLAC